MTTGTDEARLDAWERRTGLALTVAAAAFLGTYAWQILDPDMPSGLAHALTVFGISVWLIFVADYLVRLALARDRLRFVRSTCGTWPSSACRCFAR